MRESSAFDIIGPVMVGPSSSHTAGALKIAAVAGKLAKGKITDVRFKLYGSFAKTFKGHGTDRALLGGILGMKVDDLSIRNSPEIARASGVRYEFIPFVSENEFHPNTVEISVKYEGGEVFVRGSSIGGGEIEITNVNGTEISFSGRYNAFIIRQKDIPGAVAHIAGVFEKHMINIAFMHVYRDGPGDDAYSIVEIDGLPSDGLIGDIASVSSIISVSYLSLAG